jgi:hypothetical protein
VCEVICEGACSLLHYMTSVFRGGPPAVYRAYMCPGRSVFRTIQVPEEGVRMVLNDGDEGTMADGEMGDWPSGLLSLI